MAQKACGLLCSIKTVLQHGFPHHPNGISAVLGANTSPAILIPSTAPQQVFSAKNVNLMVVYFFMTENTVIKISFFSQSSEMALCLKFLSIKYKAIFSVLCDVIVV